MKRPRSISKPSIIIPSTPPTPQNLLLLHSKPNSNSNSNSNSVSLFPSFKKSRRNLTPKLTTVVTTTPNWVPLNLSKTELYLPLTFPTGQTFRWKNTGHLQFTGVVGSHLISLKHMDDSNVAYHLHNSTSNCDCVLLDFLNVGISLTDLWQHFSSVDVRFAELVGCLAGGARVLRQDPFECLIQFLCSSNNNIGRITRMVDYISSLGDHVGIVEGLDFYQFPTLERLSLVSERELREAGFGYRAKYITGTVNALQTKPGGGSEWLASLRKLELHEAIDALCTLPGVGPKVAACVALFSLDKHHAIPVDTHVWRVI